MYQTAIEVQYATPSSYPVSLKILSDNSVLENFAAIRPGHRLYWDAIKPFNVDPSSNIELRIYETHKMGIVRLRVGAVSFAANTSETSIGKRFTINVNASVPFTIVITLLPEVKARLAPQDAYQNAIKAIENFPNVLDSLGRARGAVESILGFGSAVAELNPIAKAALGICTKAWETLKKQDQCDSVMADLVSGLGDMVPVVEAVPDRAKVTRLKDTIADILRLVEDGCNFVIEYRSDGAAVRALRAFATSSSQDQVDEYLKELGRLKEKFDREIAAHVVETTETLLTDADHALIDKLLTKKAGYDHHGTGCLAGTRARIIGGILQWASNGSAPLFWLYGLAGSGKTSIAASVSQELRGAGYLLGTFFCKRDDPQLREPENLVSTIAVRLARAHKPYGVKLVKILRDNPDVLDSALSTRFKYLVSDPLHEVGQPASARRFIIVVDALDECGTVNSRKQIISSLVKLAIAVPWLRIFLTSRPNDEIRQILTSGWTPSIYACDLAKEDQNQVMHDISALVKIRLGDIPSKHMGRTTWPEDEVVSEIANRASGLFIWAETACRFIATDLDPKTRLKEILAGELRNDATMQLNELYTTALDKSFHESDNNARLIRQCVGAIVLTGVHSPLSQGVLGTFLDGYVDSDVLDRVIDGLGSVIYRDENGAVRVLHQSFSDFVLDQLQCPPRYRLDLPLHNSELAACCFRTMIKELKFNICNLENSCVLEVGDPDLSVRVRQCISGQLSYSCLNWINHLTLAPQDVLTGHSSVSEVFAQFSSQLLSLYWIEALILLKSLKVALVDLPKLLNWVTSVYQVWADDIHRFIFAFYDPIASSVPHLYISALPFGAANYETMRRWKSQFKGTVTVMQDQIVLPSHCLRVIGASFGLNPRIKSISSNGKCFILISHQNVFMLDTETGEMVHLIIPGHSEDITCATYHPDNKLLASGSEDETIRVQSLDEDNKAPPVLLRGHTDWITEVLFATDGQRVISGSYDRTIRVWSINSATQVAEIQLEHSSPITLMRLSSDGRSLLSTFKNNMLLVWELETQDVSVRLLQKFPELIRVAFALSPDGSVLVAGVDDKMVYAWHVSSGNLCLGPLGGHTGEITCITFSWDGHLIASGSEEGEIYIWDARTGALYPNLLTGHAGPITGIIFTADDKRLISSSDDHSVRIWIVPELGPDPQRSSYHTSLISSVAFSPDGKLIATGSRDSTVGLWDSQSGSNVVERFRGHSAGVTCVAFSPTGQDIISGSEDCTVRIWPITNNTAAQEPLQGHTDWVNCVAFSPSADIIASGSDDSTIRLWEAHTRNDFADPLQIRGASVKSITFSYTGRYLCAGFLSSLILVWEVGSWTVVQRISPEHDCSIYSVAFCRNEFLVASAGTDDQITVWDRQTGDRFLDPFVGHTDSVTCIAFSPDGTIIASASVDVTIRVWDTRTGALVWGPLFGHEKYITSIAFCPEGKRIVSGAADNTIRVWELPARLSSTSNVQQSQSDTIPIQGDWGSFEILAVSRLNRAHDEVQSSVPSWALQNALRPDGWVCSSSSSYIIRIPDHYQRYNIDQSSLVISPRLSDSHVSIDFSRFQAGTQWMRCKTGT
ncbi:hypothetical protein RhiJN_26806 [Ceratobasidium sp. AG-Ba]|nr:hypothetical protein RhiJN_26806 [Ceratobasidium sp. AG-Ba]